MRNELQGGTMKNVLKTLGLVATLSVLFVLGTASAFALPGVPNDSPAGAELIDNRMHTVPVQKSLWYSFNYSGGAARAVNRTPVTLRLLNGNNSGVEMEVYTFDQVHDDLADRIENWRNEQPIGKGTKAHDSNDLTWTGGFAGNGTYFVRVRNTNPFPTNFTLVVEGQDVAIAPRAAQFPMHVQ
jgi:hypothetical protein